MRAKGLTKDLVEVALGRRKADLVIKNANLVNVCSGEIYETEIAVARGVVVGLGVGSCEWKGREEIDAQGKYAVPGLVDGHTHIEMSLLSVTEFAKAVVPRGTTAVVADPHEIANVLGVAGVRAILDEAKTTPLKVFCTAPSCVPSTEPELGLETSGARLGAGEVKELLQTEERVVGLAEVMNYGGVLAKEEGVWEKLEVARALKVPIDGHAPLLRGKELNAYVLSGVGSDHECVSYEEALEKLRLGLRVLVREGSVAKNLKSLAPLLKSGQETARQAQRETRNCLLVTDGDRTPRDLKEQGYLDFVFRRAVEEGVDPVRAVQMCTLNPAEWFGLDDFLGSISPSKVADLVLLKNLERFEVAEVVVNGKRLADLDFAPRPVKWKYPKYGESVRLKRAVKPEDFEINLDGGGRKRGGRKRGGRKRGGRRRARIIGLVEGELLTEELVEEVSGVDGKGVDTARDILKIAVLERHHGTGNIGLGFVKGFGLKTGAVASSVAHDSHNIVVVGTSGEEMAFACNRLRELGGGVVLCSGSGGEGGEGGEVKVKVKAELGLPIAGLMSDRGLDFVVRKQEEMEAAVREMGCELQAPFVALSFLALPVIPKLKITDKGLVDVERREIVELEILQTG